MRVICLVLFLSMLGFSCSRFFAVTEPEKINVKADELHGVWTFNGSTLDRERTWGSKLDGENSIEIRNDGTAHFKIPFLPYGEYLDAEGSWSLDRKYESDSGKGHMLVVFSVELPGNRMYGQEFYLKRESGKLIMYTYYSDPDLNDLIEFERIAR